MTVCPVTGGRLGSATYTLVNEDEMLVGTVVGERYHVRDILGQGSTGTVFGTVHAHFERNAAMKVLRPRFAMLDTVQRIFHSEARLAFSVAHPSLCEVFDIGTLPDGAPFFVMERLEGDTLASRLGRERFSIAAAVDLMMQLLSAMEAVHARDLLLRDLRPQNIFLVNRRGCRPVLKLLDFGLSRLIPLEKVQQQWDGLRAVVGANDGSGVLSIPYYLSPERSRGEQGLEPTSDIFVAAMILYEALTGQKPFNGATWSTLLAQIAQAQPTPLTVLRPDVPEDLGALVMRALSSKPRARPPSAREMQDELRGVFEAPRRGSASMRTAPASAAADSAPQTPPHTDRSDNPTPFVGLPPMPAPRPAAGVRPEQMLPPSAGPQADRPAASTEEPFDDEMRTDRKQLDVTAPGAASSTRRRPIIPCARSGRRARSTSTSTSSSSTTIRPLPEAATSKPRSRVRSAATTKRKKPRRCSSPPEVRRRIEQMTKQQALRGQRRRPDAAAPDPAPHQADRRPLSRCRHAACRRAAEPRAAAFAGALTRVKSVEPTRSPYRWWCRSGRFLGANLWTTAEQTGTDLLDTCSRHLNGIQCCRVFSIGCGM